MKSICIECGYESDKHYANGCPECGGTMLASAGVKNE